MDKSQMNTDEFICLLIVYKHHKKLKSPVKLDVKITDSSPGKF